MNYRHELVNNILYLVIEGDILGDTDGMELADLVNDQINNNIINGAVDLSSVRYMNSTGIGVLITILTKYKNKCEKLVLIKP